MGDWLLLNEYCNFRSCCCCQICSMTQYTKLIVIRYHWIPTGTYWVKPLSHLAAFPLRWHGVVKFSRAPWDRKKTLIFFVKKSRYGVLTASLQRPWRCYGAHMAFYRVPTEFLWRFSALSRRFHCAFMALTMRALRFHGVWLRWWRVEDTVTCQNKEEGKDQELLQSCTTPDQGHRRGK